MLLVTPKAIPASLTKSNFNCFPCYSVRFVLREHCFLRLLSNLIRQKSALTKPIQSNIFELQSFLYPKCGLRILLPFSQKGSSVEGFIEYIGKIWKSEYNQVFLCLFCVVLECQIPNNKHRTVPKGFASWSVEVSISTSKVETSKKQLKNLTNRRIRHGI